MRLGASGGASVAGPGERGDHVGAQVNLSEQDGGGDGEVAEDGVLLGLNFYVEGVDDQLPQ